MASDKWPGYYSSHVKDRFDQDKVEWWMEGEKLGKQEGKRRGMAKAILLVLKARILDVSATERDLIINCSDLKQLKKWVTRAATAEKTSDLFNWCELTCPRGSNGEILRSLRPERQPLHCLVRSLKIAPPRG